MTDIKPPPRSLLVWGIVLMVVSVALIVVTFIWWG